MSSLSPLKVRTVPCSSQLSGTTLIASPARSIVTEMTAGSVGRLLRAMMLWNACTIWQATGTGSMAACGAGGGAARAPVGGGEAVVGGKPRPRGDRELARRQARPVMYAEHRLHGKAFEQPVADHLARTAAAFLGRLKHQINGAVEITLPGQMAGGGQQHRRVAVVAAGVHLAGVHARVGEGVVLADRQRVHVGTQPDRARGAAVTHDADDTRLAQPAMHRDAPLAQCARDEIRGARLLETELGVRMDIAPQALQHRGFRDDRLDQLHGDDSLSIMRPRPRPAYRVAARGRGSPPA